MHTHPPVNQSHYTACPDVYARSLPSSPFLPVSHSQTHAHNSCYTVLSNESSRSLSAANETHRHPRLSASSIPSQPRGRHGFWGTVPGRCRASPHSSTHRRSTTEPSWPLKPGRERGGGVLTVNVHVPHIHPFQPKERLERRKSFTVRRAIFRLLATSRPPSSGLHL